MHEQILVESTSSFSSASRILFKSFVVKLMNNNHPSLSIYLQQLQDKIQRAFYHLSFCLWNNPSMLRRFSSNFAVFSILVDLLIVPIMLRLVIYIRPLLNSLSFHSENPGRHQFSVFIYIIFPISGSLASQYIQSMTESATYA